MITIKTTNNSTRAFIVTTWRKNQLVRYAYANLTPDDKLAIMGRALANGAHAWAAKRACVANRRYTMTAQDIKDVMRMQYDAEYAALRNRAAVAMVANTIAIVKVDAIANRIAAQKQLQALEATNTETNDLRKSLVRKSATQRFASYLGMGA